MTKRKERTVEAAGQGLALQRLRALCVAALWLLLGGCASVAVDGSAVGSDQTRTAQQPASLGWYYVRFRLQRDDDEGVNSYLDLMLADQVLAPVIDRHGESIPLWRFHRRWPEDAIGHRFSFVFYAATEVAAAVDEQIRNNPLLAILGDQGHLLEYRIDAGQVGNVAATSDPAWPATIQREWPVFIMGASRMWLGLLQTEAALHEANDLHDRYRTTERALDALWFDEGNHAFFHHLSALFGYKPLQVTRRDVMTF